MIVLQVIPVPPVPAIPVDQIQRAAERATERAMEMQQMHSGVPQLPVGVVMMHTVDSLIPVLIVAILVAGLIAYLRMRNSWRRSPVAPLVLQPIEDRLGRLEQAVEVIGLQVERVAEGQHFVTKLLAKERTVPGQLGTGGE